MSKNLTIQIQVNSDLISDKAIVQVERILFFLRANTIKEVII